MRHQITINHELAWVVTDPVTGQNRTFQNKQAAERHLDWLEYGLSCKPAPVCTSWKSLFLRPLMALGLTAG